MTMLLLLTPSVSNSKEVKIGSGWNLIGTACEISVSELDKKGIRTVWLWDRDKAFWRAWSPDNRIMEIIDSYGLDTFETIPAYSGFWVSASGDEVITLCDVNFDVNRLVPFRGTVKYIDLEGGFYGIVDETGKEYLPLNLKDEFKVDGLKVEGIGEIEENATTVYMWGAPINVLKIEETGSITSNGTSTENSTVDLERGLVAYWSFDNCDARDDSGNGNDGEIHGSPECVDGVEGKAIRFHGIKSNGSYLDPDRIFVPNSDKLKFDRYMSIAYWVRIEGDKVQTGANCSGNAVDGKGGIVLAKSGDRNGWYISTGENGTSIGFYPWLGGKGAGVSDLEESSYKNWRFEAFVVDSLTKEIKIFVNGKLVASKKGNFDFSLPNQRDLYIGVCWNAYIPGVGGACLDYWYPLDGIIDEIRIYNRALTEEEIKTLYEQGK